ncbi:MAG: dihydrolipoyl dehydrogenase [Candidatus Carbobacillus altaicus]|nr:dihydrolipoyl dehydrogenase [Candidatus Carbobacillus altaicus]
MVVGETTIDVDVLVIGAGPGGYVAAIRAQDLGRAVHLVERAELGGVCLNRGCIPSKALITAAHQFQSARDGEAMGFLVDGLKLDLSRLQAWKESRVQTLTGGVEKLLRGRGVEVIQGEAFFVGPNEVRVYEGSEFTRYRFQSAIIATGSRPIELSALPFGGRILSSTEALNLNELPERLVVVGGGYIGVELGQMFSKLGSKVTILEGAPHILPSYEDDVVRLLKRRLKKDGVTVLEGVKVRSAVQDGKEVTITYTLENEGAGSEGEKEVSISADYVLVTVGRRPNTDGLGLDAAGVNVDERGFIPVDDQLKTNVEGIYAIGDIVPGPALAHKASYEGKIAAEVIAGRRAYVQYRAIPAVVYSDPEIATVGMSARDAETAGENVKVASFPYAANGRALTQGAQEGFVRLVFTEEDEILLGATVVGAGASELIGELTLAIEMGATLMDLALTIHAHPTLSEMIMEAAEVGVGLPVHVLKARGPSGPQ